MSTVRQNHTNLVYKADQMQVIDLVLERHLYTINLPQLTDRSSLCAHSTWA